MQKHYLIKAACGSDVTACGDVVLNHPLKKLLKQLPQTYCLFLTGEVDFFNDVKIIVKEENSGKDLDCGTLRNPNTASLIQVSSPSPFGKGENTVYDEHVRKGKEIKADRIHFELGGTERLMREKIMRRLGIVEKSFVDSLRDMILQNNKDQFLSSAIDVQFYKLAIYEPGGHFQTHRDTVHSADHKATLLLEVKSDHKGGMLTLHKNGTKVDWNLNEHKPPEDVLPTSEDNVQEFTFALSAVEMEGSNDNGSEESSDEKETEDISDNGSRTMKNKQQGAETGVKETNDDVSEIDDKLSMFDGLSLDEARADFEYYENHRFTEGVVQDGNEAFLKWLLFYTDIEHSVSPVTEGVRIVLQFDVYDRCPGKAVEEAENSQDEVDQDNEGDDEVDEDECWECFYECTQPISEYEPIGLKEKVLPQIISILKNELTIKRALVIPFYFLYTSQTILPEKLKNIDKGLFDSLLHEGFPLALVSVELVLETGSYKYSEGGKYMRIHDFPYKVYESGSTDSSEITYRMMKKLPKDLRLTYVFSGLEAITHLESTGYIEHTGNESAPGMYRYLCGAMIVFKQN
jgi:hypothetical protein